MNLSVRAAGSGQRPLGVPSLQLSARLDGMSKAVKLWTRLSAAVTGAVLALVIPVHAWAASTGMDTVMIEAAKSRRRRGGIGFLPIFGGLCCLLVVGGLILAFVLVSRNRKRR